MGENDFETTGKQIQQFLLGDMNWRVDLSYEEAIWLASHKKI